MKSNQFELLSFQSFFSVLFFHDDKLMLLPCNRSKINVYALNWCQHCNHNHRIATINGWNWKLCVLMCLYNVYSQRANLLRFISLTNSISHGKMSWKSDYFGNRRKRQNCERYRFFVCSCTKTHPNQFTLILDDETHFAVSFFLSLIISQMCRLLDNRDCHTV